MIPLSKDHHFGLLLCWKIRTGFKREISKERIAAYVTYFYQNHLLAHFEEEENFIFPLLDAGDEKRKKAEQEHRKIHQLVDKLSLEPGKSEVTLGQIEEVLEAHIRFEERDLFTYIQNSQDEAGLEQLRKKIEEIHHPAEEEWEDPFWER